MSGRVHDIKRQKIDAVLPRKRASNGSQGHKERSAQQLLPGIPDEITLDLITPKLSWRTFYVLSAVNPGWKQAIQSGQVYEARVRAKGTETLAVIDRIITGAEGFALALYSGKDKLVHKLPPIPNLRIGIPRLSQCISLDGKIYVIGGDRGFEDIGDDICDSTLDLDFSLVYVLDAARQRPWEQCKSMGYGRIRFGLGVVGGKICVLWGASYEGGSAVSVSEVYDPVCDTWHPFVSKIYWRSDHQVSTIGEELFIHGGYFSSSYEMKKVDSIPSAYEDLFHDSNEVEIADFLEVYHPGKNAWRKVTPFHLVKFEARFRKVVFPHLGRLHSVTGTAIDVYDMDKRSWTSKHSYSHASPLYEMRVADEFGNHIGYVVDVKSSAVSGNELVAAAAVRWHGERYPFEETLICSLGFGTRQDRIRWQRVECSFRLTSQLQICSLQL